MRIMKWFAGLLALVPFPALADPLDTGEAYTENKIPADWFEPGQFYLLIIEYGLFILMLIGLGWLLFKRPAIFLKIEAVLQKPFVAIFAAAKRVGGIGEFLLQLVGGIAVFLALAAWVFFCQWLKSVGLGPLSMLGLAFMAIMLVRMIKAGEDRSAKAWE